MIGLGSDKNWQLKTDLSDGGTSSIAQGPDQRSLLATNYQSFYYSTTPYNLISTITTLLLLSLLLLCLCQQLTTMQIIYYSTDTLASTLTITSSTITTKTTSLLILFYFFHFHYSIVTSLLLLLLYYWQLTKGWKTNFLPVCPAAPVELMPNILRKGKQKKLSSLNSRIKDNCCYPPRQENMCFTQ